MMEEMEPNEEVSATKVMGIDPGTNAFLLLTELPTGTAGWRKHLGLVFFGTCAVISVLLVLSLLNQSEHTYTQEFKSEVGDMFASSEHRIPDIILCPGRKINSTLKYAVYYDWRLIQELGMNTSEVNELTHQVYQSCPSGFDCRGIGRECAGTPFAEFCTKAAAIVDETRQKGRFKPAYSREEWLKISSMKMRPWHAEVLAAEVESAGNVWNITHLWWTILGGRTFEARKSIVRWKNVTHSRVFKIYMHRTSKVAKDLLKLRNFWLDDSYCFLINGSEMPAFIGIWPTPNTFLSRGVKDSAFRYWIGTIRSSRVSENFLTTMNKNFAEKAAYLRPDSAAIVFYSSVLLEKNTQPPGCIQRENIRGITLKCLEKDAESFEKRSIPNHEIMSPTKSREWFYNIDKDRKRIGNKLWIYAGSSSRILQAKTYTSYTLYQIVAGIIGSCIGVCFLQLVETATSFLQKFLKKALKMTIIRGFTFMLLLVYTSVFTYRDIQSYMNDRIGNQLERRKLDRLPVPVFELCSTGDFAFWNVTRLYDLNVSTELYSYMRVAVMQQKKAMIHMHNTFLFKNGTRYGAILNAWMPSDSPLRVVFNETAEYGAETEDFTNRAGPLWWNVKIERHRMVKNRNWMFNETAYNGMMARISNEIELLGSRLGLPPRSPLSEFIRPLSLGFPGSDFIKCQIGNQIVSNCDQYVEYRRKPGKLYPCLHLSIPGGAYEIKAGYRKGLIVEIDGASYKNNSDINGYYGPGISKYLLEKNRNKISCGGGVGCKPHVSFDLNFFHPSGGNMPTQIVFDPRGPTGKIGFAIQLKNIFSFLLPSATHNNCTEEKDRVCKFGQDETDKIFNGIHSQLLCGCMHCFSYGDKLISMMEDMLNKSLHCCRPLEDMKCHRKLVANLKVRSDGKEFNYTTKNGRKLYFFRVTPRFYDNLLRNLKVTPQVIRNILDLHENEHPDLVRKLMTYVARCKAKICKQSTFELASVRKIRTDGRYDIIQFYYDSQFEEGTTQVDRLDPAQFVGVLFCTYGATIGVSFLALIEMGMLWMIQYYSSSKENVDQGSLFRKQVMKGTNVIATFFQKKVVVSGPQQQNSGEVGEFNRSNQVNKSDEEFRSVVCENSSQDSGMKLPEAKSFELVDLKIPGAVQESKNRNRCEKKDSVQFTKNKNEGLKSKKKSKGNNIKAQKNKENVGSSQLRSQSLERNLGKSREVTESFTMSRMIVIYLGRTLVTVISFCLLAAVIAYFFMTTKTTDVSMDVLKTPIASPASLGLCLSEEKYNNTLRSINRLVEMSDCQTRDSVNFVPCTKVFAMIAKNDYQTCAVWDRSYDFSRHTLASADIKIRLRKKEMKGPLLLWVQGTNGTSVANQESTIEWWPSRDLIISYKASFFRDHSITCQPKEKTACELCRNLVNIKTNTVCCSEEGISMPLELEEGSGSCFHYSYTTSVFEKEARERNDYQEMRLVANSDFVVMSSIENKYDIVSYLSFLGGFFDFFTGLNLLNLSCIVVFSFISVFNILLGYFKLHF